MSGASRGASGTVFGSPGIAKKWAHLLAEGVRRIHAVDAYLHTGRAPRCPSASVLVRRAAACRASRVEEFEKGCKCIRGARSAGPGGTAIMFCCSWEYQSFRQRSCEGGGGHKDWLLCCLGGHRHCEAEVYPPPPLRGGGGGGGRHRPSCEEIVPERCCGPIGR
eukprot:gene15279-biopygen6658